MVNINPYGVMKLANNQIS